MHPSHDNSEPSDSEDDGDYVPPSTDTRANVSDTEEPTSKRARREDSSRQLTAEEEAEKEHARDVLLASFKSFSPLGLHPRSNTPGAAAKMVTVEKRYRFAGEDIIKVEEVPENSEDARRWPRHVSPTHKPAQMVGSISSETLQTDDSTITPENTSVQAAQSASASASESASTSPSHTDPMQASATKPPAGSKRPGPRKRKTLLSSLPDPGTQKAKKLTILDKSAMDWKSHVSDAAGAATSASLSDELEANRRGGGYLEKVEFLQRVEERREEVLERGKAQGKRRRG